MEVLRLVSKLLSQGSEEVLLKHVRNTIQEVDKDKEEVSKSTNEKPRARKLGTMKILTVSHHVNQRFLSRWSGATARPPRLLGKISPESNTEETQIHLRNCLNKMLRLAGFMHHHPTLTLNSALKQLSDRAPDLLPEHPLLEFLLGSKTLMDLQTFIDLPDRLLAETDTYQGSMQKTLNKVLRSKILTKAPVKLLQDVLNKKGLKRTCRLKADRPVRRFTDFVLSLLHTRTVSDSKGKQKHWRAEPIIAAGGAHYEHRL
uniref:Uncharacterized protein n=1 Tax=Timema poppense TaxID=170557 RepID=A0A7R9H6N3_TIMPO|nr:unnamed protein product [Timema poppensis]